MLSCSHGRPPVREQETQATAMPAKAGHHPPDCHPRCRLHSPWLQSPPTHQRRQSAGGRSGGSRSRRTERGLGELLMVLAYVPAPPTKIIAREKPEETSFGPRCRLVSSSLDPVPRVLERSRSFLTLTSIASLATYMHPWRRRGSGSTSLPLRWCSSARARRPLWWWSKFTRT